MGFQECENGVRVLEPVPYLKGSGQGASVPVVSRAEVGLMDSYEVMQGFRLMLSVGDAAS